MSRLLGEIYHAEGLDLAAGVVERAAARGMVLRGREILLLHSPHNADYESPGGGVETGENDHDALRREMLEECVAVEPPRNPGPAVDRARAAVAWLGFASGY